MTRSWSDLQQPGPAEQAPKPDSEFDRLCAELFMSGAGKRLIEVLRAKYFDTSFSLMAPERALAIRNDRQQFVRELELACERGLKANAKPK